MNQQKLYQIQSESCRTGITFFLSAPIIDPVSIGAGAIAKLAFDELVKAGAGEVAKATVSGTVELIQGLRDRIRAQFAGNDRATAAN